MADAHHRRIRQPLEDQAHEMLLALRIEGRGGLVHHEDVGTVDEDPGEGEPLLLAIGQDVLPAGVLVEPSDEETEPDVLVTGLRWRVRPRWRRDRFRDRGT